MLFKKFIKYQSLGNDFIIFDWHKKPSMYLQQALTDAGWQPFVKKNCDRHAGVGGDGILIVTHNQEYQVPEVLIFNADGTIAQTCLNGLRCVAHYLFTTYTYPDDFIIKMGNRLMKCQVVCDALSGNITKITTQVGVVTLLGLKKIKTKAGTFSGHCVDIGNPHFIIFDKKKLSWLNEHGSVIESSPDFPNKTNVEFVWKDEKTDPGGNSFNLLVYERGCGVTLACGSAVAATAGLLLSLDEIIKNELITFFMPGGNVTAWINDDEQIVLQATAEALFEGSLF